MFEATRLTFYYAITPVHMGAGSAIGAIDNPIQREVHTQHPVFAGSGLKGALRHHFNRAWPRVPKPNGKDGETSPNPLVGRIFGPETDASDFAGALSLSDAQLVVLPVRSLKNAFIYATCPLALARIKRLAELAGLKAEWSVPSVQTDKALVASDGVLAQGRLVLEAFEFEKTEGNISAIATWLADHAVPADNANQHFADKLKTDLVILTDTDFAHFASHAMVVEPHVRIDDDSGTADDGGLFYTENLPPETIMAGLTQASVERFKKSEKDKVSDRFTDAEKVLAAVFEGNGHDKPGIADKLLQVGGDATTGRGLVLVRAIKKEG